MQPISTFNPALGCAVALIGPPGGGKSVLGCRLFPKTYVLVSDLNFPSAIRHLTKIGELNNVVGFDATDVDEKGAVVPLQQRYPRVIKCLNDATQSADVETIFLDSATFLADIFMAKLTLSSRIDDITWGKEKASDYLRIWRSIINQLRTSGKRLIVSMHERVAKDALDDVLRNQINLWGALRDNLPYMVSDMWRCEAQLPNLPTGKHEYKVRVLGDSRNRLKNNFGFEQAVYSQDELVKLVRQTLPPVLPPLSAPL